MTKRVSVSNAHRAAINAEVDRCIEVANARFNRMFKRPRIVYEVRGKVAGRATYSENKIDLNSILIRENGDKFIGRTVGHEVAHLISYKVYGNPGSGHGKYWKSVMRLFGLEVSRCHSYDTSNSTVYNRTKHVYQCSGCGKYMTLGPTRHKRQQRAELFGRNHYSHSSCNRAKIVYIKNAGKVSMEKALGL